MITFYLDQTFVSFVIYAKTNEGAFHGPELKLMTIEVLIFGRQEQLDTLRVSY